LPVRRGRVAVSKPSTSTYFKLTLKRCSSARGVLSTNLLSPSAPGSLRCRAAFNERLLRVDSFLRCVGPAEEHRLGRRFPLDRGDGVRSLDRSDCGVTHSRTACSGRGAHEAMTWAEVQMPKAIARSLTDETKRRRHRWTNGDASMARSVRTSAWNPQVSNECRISQCSKATSS
jgi:hypothetical protein